MSRSSVALALCACITLTGGCESSSAPAGTPSAAVTSSTPAAATTAAPGPAPVLTVDEKHLATVDGSPSYEVPPSSAVVLDAKGYTFKPDARGGKEPNAVHVVHGPTEYYRADWDRSGRVTLGASSLSPVRGKETFAGFVAGEKYMVAVGTEAEDSSTGAMKFAPMWMAKLEVASK